MYAGVCVCPLNGLRNKRCSVKTAKVSVFVFPSRQIHLCFFACGGFCGFVFVLWTVICCLNCLHFVFVCSLSPSPSGPRSVRSDTVW